MAVFVLKSPLISTPPRQASLFFQNPAPPSSSVINPNYALVGTLPPGVIFPDYACVGAKLSCQVTILYIGKNRSLTDCEQQQQWLHSFCYADIFSLVSIAAFYEDTTYSFLPSWVFYLQYSSWVQNGGFCGILRRENLPGTSESCLSFLSSPSR